MSLSIEPSVIAISISIVTFLGGVISHFFIVVKKQVEMDTRLKQLESDVVELKKHIPMMESRINEVHVIVSRMDAQQKFIYENLRK